MNATPQIVKCEVTGECFQVQHWPTGVDRDLTVALKGLARSVDEPVDGFFENYTVVC
jgi:hypothetical protein